MAKEDHASSDTLLEYMRVELEVEQQARAEKGLRSMTTQKIVLKSSCNRFSASQMTDRVLETVKPHYVGLAMKPVREIFCWTVSKVFELRPECKSPPRQWNGRGEQACELFAVKYNEVGSVLLRPSSEAKCGRHSLPSFLSEQKVLESKMKAGTQKGPLQGMFSTEDKLREVSGKMIYIQNL